MSQQAIFGTTSTTSTTSTKCDPAVAVTRSLLGYGIIAMPFYVAVSVTEGLTRSGFDFTRHDWSLLANGRMGWIHITNLILTGAMIIAFAAGVRRGKQSKWGPRLLAGYGIGLIGAGVLRADPALGFPAGTPDGSGAVTWHGAGHLISAGFGFACLIAACFVLARSYARNSERNWARFTRTTGVVFGLSFLGIAATGGAAISVVVFTAAVLLVTVWSSATAVRAYRTANQ